LPGPARKVPCLAESPGVMPNFCAKGGRRYYCAVPYDFEQQKACEFFLQGKGRACAHRVMRGKLPGCGCDQAKRSAHVRGATWADTAGDLDEAM